MKFLHLFRHRETHKPSEVYVVGQVIAGYMNGVQQIIGVAETREEAYDICVDYIMQKFGGDYNYQITKWDDCCNIKIVFCSGIVHSHTFRIEIHEVKKGR